MKALRIIIEGELPKRCYKCDYKTRDIVTGGYVCLARSAIRPRLIADVSSVPDWCPLIEDGVDFINWFCERHGTPIEESEEVLL